MTLSITDYNNLRRLERAATDLGLRFVIQSYRNGSDTGFALVPVGDSLPIYSRDAEVFRGTVDELLATLNGWDIAMRYLKALGVVDDEKIAKAEDQYRQQWTIDKLRGIT